MSVCVCSGRAKGRGRGFGFWHLYPSPFLAFSLQISWQHVSVGSKWTLYYLCMPHFSQSLVSIRIVPLPGNHLPLILQKGINLGSCKKKEEVSIAPLDKTRATPVLCSSCLGFWAETNQHAWGYCSECCTSSLWHKPQCVFTRLAMQLVRAEWPWKILDFLKGWCCQSCTAWSERRQPTGEPCWTVHQKTRRITQAGSKQNCQTDWVSPLWWDHWWESISVALQQDWEPNRE